MSPRERYVVVFRELFERDPAGCAPQAVEAAERALGVALPLALRDYHVTCGGEHALNDAHNRIQRPGQLALEDGRVVFCEENQAAIVWGCRPVGDDPVVEQGVVVEGAERLEWYDDVLRVAPFLELMMYLQCAWGGYAYSAQHDDPDAVLSRLDASWALRVDHDRLRIWQRPGLLLSALEGDGFVIGAARTEQGLRWLHDRLGFAPS